MKTCQLENDDGHGIASRTDAVIFALDGVVVDTVDAHDQAWKQLFDEALPQLGRGREAPLRPFDIAAADRQRVEGRPAVDGVQRVLRSRGIDLEPGAPGDPSTRLTLHGLANRKTDIVRRRLDADGIRVLPGVVRLIRRLRAQKIKTAVVSFSRTCRQVLDAVGIADLFDACIDARADGQAASADRPRDRLLQAAAAMNAAPARTVLVDDTLVGMQAGRRGGFGCVLGLDRHGRGDALVAAGAHRVIDDLAAIDAAVPPKG